MNKILFENIRFCNSGMGLTRFITIQFIVIVWLSSCNIVNPHEQIPTYIEIDSVQLKPTVSSIHGSVSHKITDVWVYYNRQILGAFELPAKIPILAEGTGQIQILAGIWDNGLSGTRARYPFYAVDTFTFNANPTNTVNYTPKFTYRTTDTPALSYFVEDFEQGNSFEPRSGSLGSIQKTSLTDEVFEGTWSGKIALNDSVTNAEVITTKEYNIPPNRDCYMEFNYKSDMQVLVRTEIYQLGTYVYSDVIGLNAKSSWTKIYIKLTGFGTSFQYGKFKFIFKGAKPSDVSQSNFLIDNFKIIYFD